MKGGTGIRLLLAVGGLIVAVLVGLLATGGTDSGAPGHGNSPGATGGTATPGRDTTPGSAPGATVAPVPGSAAPRTAPAGSAPAATPAPGVPDRAYATLAEIDAGRWPDSANAPGTRGGDRFGNRENRLPGRDANGGPITYQEWDVNPKQRNRSRDAERIVTGSDGSAWYTGDHYATFTRMR